MKKKWDGLDGTKEENVSETEENVTERSQIQNLPLILKKWWKKIDGKE